MQENETARRDLLDLTKAGLLEMRRDGKAFLFIAPSDLSERVYRAKGSVVSASAALNKSDQANSRTLSSAAVVNSHLRSA